MNVIESLAAGEGPLRIRFGEPTMHEPTNHSNRRIVHDEEIEALGVTLITFSDPVDGSPIYGLDLPQVRTLVARLTLGGIVNEGDAQPFLGWNTKRRTSQPAQHGHANIWAPREGGGR